MTYAKMGKANVDVSRICLGTLHFGPKTDKNEAFRIMDKAVELGINFFDTANIYGRHKGPGTSEAIIGQWFEQSGKRESVVLASKVYHSMTGKQEPNEAMGISRYKVRRHLEASLRRLRTDRIDLYQVHHIDRRVTREEFWDAFEFHLNRGEIAYVGTSNFPGWALMKYDIAAERRSRLGIVSEQSQYNLLNRYAELEVIPAAQERAIGIMPYMPLAGGTLAGKVKVDEGSRTEEVAREYHLYPLAEFGPLRQFRELCNGLGEKAHVVAIAWLLQNPAVYSVVVGPRTESHLEGLDRAAELELNQETVEKLNKIFDVSVGRPLSPGPAPEAYAW